MTQYSYSRVSLFEDCPYHFRLRYIDKLTELPKLDADNPLIIGNALHKGIETDVETALEEYYNAFPVLTNAIIHEAMKLEILIPKVKDYLVENFVGFDYIHEYYIDKPDYRGFVDLILTTPNGESMVLDFKYSNNIKNYLDSGQLHIYKHYLEQDGFDVKRMAFLFVPKTGIKQKDNEDLFHYRKRIVQAVEDSSVKMVPIEYDEMNVVYFKNSIKKIETANSYPKNVSGNCFSCNPRFQPNYLEAIQNEKGEVQMALPKNERRERTIDTRPDFWIYADSYVGKSTFVDQVDNVLFLNTDGNTDNTTAPVIPLKDEVTKEGRRTVRKLAWEVFLDTIQDLETVENDYEAVALDLVEDIYEQCRVYVFEKNGWEHESDGSYGKGWSKVTTEFNNAMKRLKALGYQVIYISKEIAEEISLKGGAKRTTFKPNIKDKIANFLTGTVDLTLRAYVDSNDERHLQLAKKQNVFGGGRFDFQVDTIPLEMDTFIEELTAAQEGKITKKKTDKPKRESKKRDTAEEENEKVSEAADQVEEEAAEEKPKRHRKRRDSEPEEKESTEEEKPKRQRKSRNSSEDEKEEKSKRQRRERKAVDDTPPGEEDSSDSEEPAEENPADDKPKRTRKRRTRVNN
ncbi:AAA family ATPase [Oceanobacillus kapialis]|uniref:AAA family ATPase n=1 Tax=Oceanobacillus kapialis TaxID=481353 RepID=A0ABW5PZG5_9BACI